MSQLETNGSKNVYVQVETPIAFNTRGEPDVFSLHHLRAYQVGLLETAAPTLRPREGAEVARAAEAVDMC